MRSLAIALHPRRHPEERADLARVSKDGRRSVVSHPSRLAEEARTSSDNGEAVTLG